MSQLSFDYDFMHAIAVLQEDLGVYTKEALEMELWLL